MMADRCTGRCCKSFIIRSSPEEIRQRAEETSDPRWKAEFTKIADMIIHLGTEDSYHHRYTCKHFDAKTHNCTDYEHRPEMCRDFPYGDPCPFVECEWNPGLKPDVSVRMLRRSAILIRLNRSPTGSKRNEGLAEYAEAKPVTRPWGSKPKET